jgi:TorA maturation chaperone TorD
MANTRQEIWQAKGDLYAFFGNSLLNVMTEENAVGINPSFWEQFPLAVHNKNTSAALDKLIFCSSKLSSLDRKTAIEQVAIEYSELFVGPGAPEAPPWETLYRSGVKVLFGQSTFDMKRLFAKEGLKASAQSHQLEDHLGFELLYLSAKCHQFAEFDLSDEALREQQGFIEEHPLSFISKMREKAEHSSTTGYYPALLQLIEGFLLLDSANIFAKSN